METERTEWGEEGGGGTWTDIGAVAVSSVMGSTPHSTGLQPSLRANLVVNSSMGWGRKERGVSEGGGGAVRGLEWGRWNL